MSQKELKKVSADQLHQLMKENEGCQIIDVREASELKTEKLESAMHTPLSSLDNHLEKIQKDKDIYVLCRTGNRAQKAAEQLKNKGYSNIHIIEGGLEACKSCGVDVTYGASSMWSIERQVRFAAGLLVMVGVVLSILHHTSWIWLSGGVAFGLMFSSLTNTCGMGMVLLKMPWNKG